MKNVQVFILLHLIFYCSTIFAQDPVIIEPTDRIPEIRTLTTIKRVDHKLNIILHMYKCLIEMRCHPKMNTIGYEDFAIDSTDNISVTKSEVIIYIKNSFCWNIDSGLPKIPKASVIKSLLKRKEKITTEEWKILKYMEFYGQGSDKKYVDKFEYYQEIEVNHKDKYNVQYELKYDCNEELKIVSKNIKKIEVTNTNTKLN